MLHMEMHGIPTEVPDSLLPTPLRVLPVALRDGEEIVLRQHGNPAGPRILFSHGNGMATDLYYPFWRHFLERFEVVVYDLRNHGWNRTGDPRRHHFAAFVFDNERVLDALDRHWGAKPALGVFHSLSALAALYQALRAGPRWAGLVLFDPPLTPPLGHPLEEHFLEGQVSMSARTAKRQERFADYLEFEAVLRRAPIFSGLVEACYPLYAAATLRRCADGDGVELRCPRALEAKIYLANLDSTIDLAMGAFPTPLKVIGGDPRRPGAGPPSRVCEALFPGWGIEYEHVPGTGHFLQLEAPQTCARLTEAFFARLGLD